MNEHADPVTVARGATRRAVLAAAAGAGVTLGGCAQYGGNEPPPPAATGGAGTGGSGDDGASGGAGGTSGAAGGSQIARIGDVPVGGGVILADRGVVLTQPTAGTVRAFSAVCTHAGCTVEEVSGGTINCPCHGSAFAVADGAVAKGPASRPLAPVAVKVDGDAIRLA